MAKVFEGNFLNVYRDEQNYPNGYKGNVEYIKHPGAVLILPVLKDGRIVFIKQYRPTIGKYIYELPAGTLESGEEFKECAHRELIEETGYKAAKIEELAPIYPCPGYSTEIIYMFKATDLIEVEHEAMDDEDIEVVLLDEARVKDLIAKKEINDAKTLAALIYAK